jgi:hypothetical protein
VTLNLRAILLILQFVSLPHLISIVGTFPIVDFKWSGQIRIGLIPITTVLVVRADLRRLPECDRCQMFSHSEYLVCAIHPEGYKGMSCPDFAQIPGFIEDSPWAPIGYTYYGGELVSNSQPHLSREDQLWMLEHHPLFTGKCPLCQSEIPGAHAHFDCDRCGWIDDSV